MKLRKKPSAIVESIKNKIQELSGIPGPVANELKVSVDAKQLRDFLDRLDPGVKLMDTDLNNPVKPSTPDVLGIITRGSQVVGSLGSEANAFTIVRTQRTGNVMIIYNSKVKPIADLIGSIE